MATVNIPSRGSDNQKQQGKNVMFFVNVGPGATVANPNWVLVGGQRNSPLEMSADEIDVSDKNSGGWGDMLPGTKNWSISLDSIYVLGDIGVAALKQAFLNDQEIQIMRWHKGGNAEVGWCSVTEFSDDVPHDDAMSITGTLNGRGAPTFLEGVEYPGGIKDLTATADLEAVDLDWTALTDATSIKAQYSTNEISWNDVNVSSTASAVTIENLVSGLQYYFRLYVIGGNKAGYSNTVTAAPM